MVAVDWNQVWTITLVGIGTVFVTLIVLAFILSQFSKIFNIMKTNSAPVAKAPVAPAPAPVVATSSGIDGKVIAAITAAIAAASGRSASSFRIASVQPTGGGFTTPAWGHIDRLQRAPQGRLN